MDIIYTSFLNIIYCIVKIYMLNINFQITSLFIKMGG